MKSVLNIFGKTSNSPVPKRFTLLDQIESFCCNFMEIAPLSLKVNPEVQSVVIHQYISNLCIYSQIQQRGNITKLYKYSYTLLFAIYVLVTTIVSYSVVEELNKLSSEAALKLWQVAAIVTVVNIPLIVSISMLEFLLIMLRTFSFTSLAYFQDRIKISLDLLFSSDLKTRDYIKHNNLLPNVTRFEENFEKDPNRGKRTFHNASTIFVYFLSCCYFILYINLYLNMTDQIYSWMFSAIVKGEKHMSEDTFLVIGKLFFFLGLTRIGIEYIVFKKEKFNSYSEVIWKSVIAPSTTTKITSYRNSLFPIYIETEICNVGNDYLWDNVFHKAFDVDGKSVSSISDCSSGTCTSELSTRENFFDPDSREVSKYRTTGESDLTRSESQDNKYEQLTLTAKKLTEDLSELTKKHQFQDAKTNENFRSINSKLDTKYEVLSRRLARLANYTRYKRSFVSPFNKYNTNVANKGENDHVRLKGNIQSVKSEIDNIRSSDSDKLCGPITKDRYHSNRAKDDESKNWSVKNAHMITLDEKDILDIDTKKPNHISTEFLSDTLDEGVYVPGSVSKVILRPEDLEFSPDLEGSSCLSIKADSTTFETSRLNSTLFIEDKSNNKRTSNSAKVTPIDNQMNLYKDELQYEIPAKSRAHKLIDKVLNFPQRRINRTFYLMKKLQGFLTVSVFDKLYEYNVKVTHEFITNYQELLGKTNKEILKMILYYSSNKLIKMNIKINLILPKFIINMLIPKEQKDVFLLKNYRYSPYNILKLTKNRLSEYFQSVHGEHPKTLSALDDSARSFDETKIVSDDLTHKRNIVEYANYEDIIFLYSNN